MRLTLILCKAVPQVRFSNYIKLDRIPGNVFEGKHKVRRRLSPLHKLYLQRRIGIELENMSHLSRAYLTEAEDNFYLNDPEKKAAEAAAVELKKRQEEIPKNRYFIKELLQPLTLHKKWE
ncbi:unnamed protein product [Didymodactylos carnosus]|uniref:Uncharacterized protein n=1 Tax=Didymodactylos carnosus TaxID=1234261 RepID=A0A813XHI8_9BILA|nr:unnamed protein product [Didymodactylos carnosus]CAF1593039.1 unnamed protein product [Didymodactylos carnosus]CAF3652456.1 unnamed protein product [Didymodactylos carnosus]CAF4397797.1 unnamed protein product [Didymodactylos carnosus]